MAKKYNKKSLGVLISLLILFSAAIFVLPIKAKLKTSQAVNLKIIVTDQQAPGVIGVIDDFLASSLGDGVDDVTVVASGTRADDQLTYLISQMQIESEEFDVIGLDTIWPAQFAENGWIIELGPLLDENEMNAYVPGMVDSCTYKGKIWAYPYFMNLGVLFYRNDILTRNGYSEDDIETWAELKTVANAILNDEDEQDLNPDLVGYVGQLDVYEGGVVNFFEWCGSFGATEIITSDGKVDINNDDVNAAMTFIKGLIPPQYTGVMNNSYIIPRSGLVHDEGSSVGVWLAGNAIFMRQWTFAYGLSVDEGMDFGVAPLPTATGAADEKSSCVGGAVLSIPKYSKHKTEALNLIKFLGDKLAQEFELTNISNFPALKSVYDSPPTGYEWIDEWKDQLAKTLSRPVHPDYSQVSTVIADYFSDLLSCQKDVDTALEEMEADAKEILGKEAPPPIPGFSVSLVILSILSTIGIIFIIRRRNK